MTHRFRALAISLAIGLASTAPLAATAATDHRSFDGKITHISNTNVKVYGREGHVNKELSFDFFYNTTYRKHFSNGEMVHVRYDQKGVGLQHLDGIAPLK